MSKPRRKQKDDIEPFELPALLEAARMQAMAKQKPTQEEVDTTPFPNLVSFLTPFAMPDNRHKGDGQPRTVLRDALLLISFDRRAGMWKVNLTDKQLGMGGSVQSKRLETALHDVEMLLANGAFPWGAKEDS